jgi:hypothetical protein
VLCEHPPTISRHYSSCRYLIAQPAEPRALLFNAPNLLRLPASPAVFFLVNATYICLIYELIDRAPVDDILPRERRIMHFRSVTTLVCFPSGCGHCIEISAACTRNVCLLSDRLSETRGARSDLSGHLLHSRIGT